MKKLVIASAFVAVASSASAGSTADPVIEAPVIVEETNRSSGGMIIPLMLFVALAIAVGSGSSGTGR